MEIENMYKEGNLDGVRQSELLAGEANATGRSPLVNVAWTVASRVPFITNRLIAIRRWVIL
jgi:hypothetical protein